MAGRLIGWALRKLGVSNVRFFDLMTESERLLQVSANMQSGEEIHVMESSDGWHVGFGDMSPYNASKAVDEKTAAKKILKG